MKANDKLDHPEIIEVINICAISPDVDGVKEVCELIKTTKVSLPQENGKRAKKEQELDRNLKETFPASDAITRY